MKPAANTAPGDSVELLTADGIFDTRIMGTEGYRGITLEQIEAMAVNPVSVAKEQAPFAIFSTYRESDGRKHEVQRDKGEYHALPGDVDTGSPSLEALDSALVAVFGDVERMIYSSASASKDKRKWRYIVPLAAPISGFNYTDAQRAVFALMDEQGITCDDKLKGAGQPVFLPNCPPTKRDKQTGDPLWYQHKITHGPRFVVRGSNVLQRVHQLRQAEENARQQTLEQARKKAEIRRSGGSGDSPIDGFNRANSVESLLSQYGYQQKGSHWRSPYQDSGSFATKTEGEFWVSLSGSDADAGLGGESSTGARYGDAFDLYCHFEHGGDVSKAIGHFLQGSPRGEFSADDSLPPDDTPSESKLLDPCEIPGDLMTQAIAARPRIYGNFMFRGKVSVLGGPGGVGKSVMQLTAAVSLALGRDLLGVARKYEMKRPRKVLILNNEDDLGEMQLRLRAIFEKHQLTQHEINTVRQNLRYQSGYHRQLKLAITDPTTRTIRPTALKQELNDYLQSGGFDALLVDPLMSTHDAVENENTAMDEVMAIIKSIAATAAVGVLVLHHTKKLSGVQIDFDEALRGASSIKDAARAIFVITRMTPREAKSFGIEADERPRFIRLDDGKQNYALPSGEATWYKLESVGFDARDEDGDPILEFVGVPVPVHLEIVDPDDHDADPEYVNDQIRLAVVKALHDEVWPITVTQHSDRICRALGVGDRAMRNKVQAFPLLDKSASDAERERRGALVFTEFGRFRVWRVMGNRNATVLHREDAGNAFD